MRCCSHREVGEADVAEGLLLGLVHAVGKAGKACHGRRDPVWRHAQRACRAIGHAGILPVVPPFERRHAAQVDLGPCPALALVAQDAVMRGDTVGAGGLCKARRPEGIRHMTAARVAHGRHVIDVHA